MDPTRWRRLQELFHASAELPPAERRGFLEAQCPGEPALVNEALALVAEDSSGESLLHRPLAELAGAALADPRFEAPPRELGPYRLRELIGEGGMGLVYRAERPDLQSLVAIKFLRDAWLSPARRARFTAEQRTLAQLNHPCIARLYDADTLPDGTPWFAMEYVDGLPITRFCEEHRLPVRGRLELFRSVCEAVQHAHQHAVIHRDLKPSNILVTRGGQPKLLDFGIAKPLDPSGDGEPGTRTGLRLMTPAYAAPEQFRGEGLGVHTDIYSLGVILYELLTGRLPWSAGSDALEAARLEARREPEKPSVAARRSLDPARGGVPAERVASWADLDVLCLTAMQPEPARRYRTVESLIRDLDHYLRDEPLEARPDSAGYRLGKFLRRHWAAVSAVVLGVALVVGLVAFYTARLERARNAAVTEAERTRRIQRFMNGLFEGGDPDAGPSDTLRVVSLLARGEREARALSGEPAIQAELYQTLGESYQKLGEFDRAGDLFTLALSLRRSTFGEHHPDVGRSLVALGLLRADRSEYAAADSLVQLGIAIGRRRAGDDPGTLARALVARGMVLDLRGEYDEAIGLLEEAVRLDSLARSPAPEVSAGLTELANLHFYTGHYAIADSLNRRVIEMDRSIHGDRHPHVASDLINLGAIRQEMGDWPGAEKLYREALAIYRGWYGENHFETAAALTMVGRTLVQQDRLAEARAPLEQALAVRESIYGPRHPSVASTLNETALLAQREGRLDDSERAFHRMIAIYREIYRGKHYLIGLAYSNLGGVYMERKDFHGAEQRFREGLAAYRETLEPDHLYIGVTQLKLGRALLRQERFAEAEAESRAGYDIMQKQPEPPTPWLQNARRDLVAEHEGLGHAPAAARFRAELERTERELAAGRP